jgi:hypothetical protein
MTASFVRTWLMQWEIHAGAIGEASLAVASFFAQFSSSLA